MSNSTPTNTGSTLFLPEIESLALEQPVLYESLRKLRDAVVSLQGVVKAGQIAPEGSVNGVAGSLYIQHSPQANAPVGVYLKTGSAGNTGWVPVISAPAGTTSSNSVKTSSGTQTSVVGENPSGAKDGSNETFTLQHTPNPASSVQVYLNSVRYYLFTVNNNTITLDYAPVSSDTVTVNYTY